jgi:hypothetical protein
VLAHTILGIVIIGIVFIFHSLVNYALIIENFLSAWS